MQLFVYKVFKIILLMDFHYNYPINGLLVLYMFTCKSYVIFPLPSLFSVRLTIITRSFFLHKNIKAYRKYTNKTRIPLTEVLRC